MTVSLDIYLKSYKTSDKEPILDFEVRGDGTLTTFFGETAVKQRAVLSSFTQKGSIPQLPDTGIEWAEMLTGQISPAMINSEIFTAIHQCADTYGYLPQYLVVDGILTVEIKEQL